MTTMPTSAPLELSNYEHVKEGHHRLEQNRQFRVPYGRQRGCRPYEWSRQGVSLDRGDRLGSELGRHLLAVEDHVPPAHVDHDPDRDTRGTPHQRSWPQSATVPVLRDQPSWVRIEPNAHQEAHVQQLERGIRLRRVPHHRVMIHPQHADGQERDDVANVRRPCLVDGSTDGRSGGICGDIKNEYGRRNGEHSAGEGVKSVRLHRQEVSVDADRKREYLLISVLV